MLINILLACLILYVFSFIFVKLDYLIDEIISQFKHKMIDKERLKITFLKTKLYIQAFFLKFVNRYHSAKIENINKQIKYPNTFGVYESSGDIFEDLKNTPLREFYLNIYRFFFKITELPYEIKFHLKLWYQRAKRGYADSDVWSFDGYLSDVIVNGIKRLREKKHGYPLMVAKKSDPVDETGNLTEEADQICIERWNKILDSIILTFEISKKITNDHWYYQDSKNYDKKLANKYRKLQKELREKRSNLYDEYFGYVMSKEECKVYEKGWKNFQKYYANLWD